MPYCPKCGQEVTSDDLFCPKCGAQLTITQPPIERRYRGEKAEKEEKTEKREKEEKEEKHEEPADRSGPLIGGLILIWLGITFYLAQMNYIGWNVWWAYFLIGIGAILLLQAAIRYLTSPYKSSATGSLIGGLIMIAIGLVGVSGVRDWWPFIFIAIGIAVILAGLSALKRSPRPK